MYIRIDILRFMSMLVTKLPRVTPHRDQLIVNDVQKYVASTVNSNELHVEVKEIYLGAESDNMFCPSADIILHCIRNLPRTYVGIDFEGMDVKILLPKATHCCERKLKIDPRHSNVVIYSDTGIKECLNFHRTCNVCKRKYYYNYVEDTNRNRIFDEVEENEYFVISRTTGFCRTFLTRITQQIVIGATSFDKIAKIYNEMFDLYDGKALTTELVENNWLLYMIAKKIPTIPWLTKSNNHVDVESICINLYPELKNSIDAKWTAHISCGKTYNAKMYHRRSTMLISSRFGRFLRCKKNEHGNRRVKFSCIKLLQTFNKGLNLWQTTMPVEIR